VRTEPARRAVVIAGGSIAAVETLGALSTLAPGRVSVTLLAPEETFTYRPLTLAVDPPADRPPAPALRDLAASLGATHVRDRIAWVDAATRSVHTAGGTRLGFDALVLAIGARVSPAYRDALMLEPAAAGAVLDLLAHARTGCLRRVAFVVPERSGWLLALYETVLALAQAGEQAGAPLEVLVLTVERAPLAVFGRRASRRMSELLDGHGVKVLADVHTDVAGAGRVRAHGSDGSRWETTGLDRVVAVPHLHGPFLRGLPIADAGFIPIDPYCRVPGHHEIFAAGDVTSYAVKHGGIAAQQGDVVARGIAALVGVPDVRRPFRPRLEARLLTGAAPLYLGADLIGGEPFGSVATDVPERAAGPKVIAEELDRVLDRAASAALPGVQPDVEHRV
jgi:sulfide:quinone oxidoreductase